MASSACDLFLIRHGVTDWNETGRVLGRIDVGLNVRGRAEADAVASALREFPVRAVIVSPQRRTQETAEPIARMHDLTIRTEPGLDEVWAGRWQGKTRQELQGDPDLQRYAEDPTSVCDAIEPAARVQERIVAAADRLRSEATGETVLLVSHADPIKLLLAHYLSMDLAAYRRVTISTASVSVLRFGPPFGRRLLVLNWKPAGGLRQLVA